MSGFLVGNGVNLYRRDNSLVRSPIYKTIQLTHDGMMYYPICGEYVRTSGAISTVWPGRGFCSAVGQVGPDFARAEGKLMRRAYCGVLVPTYQSWWRVDLREPLFVFYHGQYGVSAEDTFCCEAFMQIPAYHFTIPSEYSGYSVASATLSVVHHGTFLQLQRAGNVHYFDSDTSKNRDYYISSAPTSLVPADSNWRDQWVQKVGIYDDGLSTTPIWRVHENATDTITLENTRDQNDIVFTTTTSTGSTTYTQTNRYAGVLGAPEITYPDDGMPTTYHPWTQSIQLGSQIVNSLNSWRSGWIVISPDVSVTSDDDHDTDNDYPLYYPDNWGRYLCCSFGSYGLTLRFQIG